MNEELNGALSAPPDDPLTPVPIRTTTVVVVANYNADAFAIDAEGNAVVGWSQNKTIRAVHFVSRAGWQKPVSLGIDSSSDALFGGIAFDADGNAFGVWTDKRGFCTCMGREV